MKLQLHLTPDLEEAADDAWHGWATGHVFVLKQYDAIQEAFKQGFYTATARERFIAEQAEQVDNDD